MMEACERDISLHNPDSADAWLRAESLAALRVVIREQPVRARSAPAIAIVFVFMGFLVVACGRLARACTNETRKS